MGSLSEKFPKKIQRRVLDSRGDLEAGRDRWGDRYGEEAFTDDEAEQASGMPHQKISARRRELVLLGLSHGRETPGRPVAADALSSGRPSKMTWRLQNWRSLPTLRPCIG